MESFDLNGKIISREQIPIANLNIEAYDEDPILKPDDFLGDSVTDSKGIFSIEFDKSKFDDFWEALDGTPDVFLLVKDDKNQDLIKTREVKTKKEIEYHIRV